MIKKGKVLLAPKHSHRFVEEFEGFVGFGLSRKSNENTVVYFLQKFSDDGLMKRMKERLTHTELEDIFEMISLLLRKHLTKSEYHRLFLKEDIETE